MKIFILSIIIIFLIIYLSYILYKDYKKDDLLLSNGLISHLIEDNGKKALEYYNKTDSYNKQENIANIYFYGTKNTKRDLDKALLYYKRVFLYDPDNANIKNVREKINYIIKYNLLQSKNNKQDLEEGICYNENIINNINSNNEIKKIEDTVEYKKDNNTHIQNDKESAHDNGINNTIQISLNKLKNNVIIFYSYSEIYKKILDDLDNSDFDEIDKFRIRNVLKEITKKQNFVIHNMKLKECLTLIGNRIYLQENKENVKIILLNLFNELNDCIKDTGEMLCLIGIFNRIINSLNIVDELVVIKPTWAIREELMRKCCKIRKNLEKNISNDDINFINKLKDEIIITLKKEYVHDNNILSLDDFNKEIYSWIDFI